MNELQQKEFELLKCFIEICEKLELTYYLVCGSALGAVKYKGFIPWDDVVDVACQGRIMKFFVKKQGTCFQRDCFCKPTKQTLSIRTYLLK